MLSLTWKDTRSDPASVPRKTSVLRSARFSRLSAVHNHETACGIPRFHTPPLNRGNEGKWVSEGSGPHSEPSGAGAASGSRSCSVAECPPSFTLSTSFPALKARCRVPGRGGGAPGFPRSLHLATQSAARARHPPFDCVSIFPLLRLSALISVPNTE